MFIIDYQDRRPIYEQIVEKVQLMIMKGILTANSQMPSVRKLAVELSINPNTIQKAYTMLEQQGFIYPVKGRGNFVADNEDVIRMQRELYKEELKKVVNYAKVRGVAKKEFLNTAKAYYEEGIS